MEMGKDGKLRRKKKTAAEKVAGMGRRRKNSLDISYFQAGLKVWIENPYDENTQDGYRRGEYGKQQCTRPKYVPAVCVKSDAALGKVSVRTDFTPNLELMLLPALVWPRNNETNLDDMINFPHLHEPALLNNVRVRYNAKQIYTKAGEILCIMNPYTLCRDKNGVGIYDELYMKKYRNRPSEAALARMSAQRRADARLPPHVFETADVVYTRLFKDMECQSVIISGESGAGKTETTKQIMQYVANISSLSANAGKRSSFDDLAGARRRSIGRRGSLGGPDNKFQAAAGDKALIEQQLLQSNPILESFGNSKTLRNNNSSRFGKYLRIFFSRTDQTKIIAGSIDHFLLEKSRVCSQLPGERSYHFFYQLCAASANAGSFAGMTATLKECQVDSGAGSFAFLSKSGSHEICDAYMGGSTSNDLADFRAVHDAMRTCGFPEDVMCDVLRSAAATLHLGNVEFASVEDSNSASGHVVSGVASHAQKSFTAACKLLGISEKGLMDAVSTKETTAAGQTTITRLGPKSAKDSCEALALELYSRTFAVLVKEINAGIKRTCVEKLGVNPNFDKDPASMFIGILDIFGFEVFDQDNGFEQLLINYANERLHNLFIKHVFKLEEEKYRREHIDFSKIQFEDNKIVIDLINKKPLGLFHQISDACMFNKMTDDRLLQGMFQKLKRTSDRNGNPTPASRFRNPGFKHRNKFVVVHSANEVMYTVDSFIEKNKDLLQPTIERLLQNESKNALVHGVFQPKSSGASGSGKKPGNKRSTLTGANVMLSLRFDENISRLVQTIEVTALSFVRCIKSNECKKPFFFNTDKVYNQLQYLGVLDSIRIRHDGFSYQKPYQEFFEYYVIVVPAGGGDPDLKLVQPPGTDYRALSLKLFNVLWTWGGGTLFPADRRAELVQFGDTKLFMRKQLSQSLEALREVKLRAMDEATVRIQAIFRMFRARRIIRSFYSGWLRLQSAWRAIRYRRIWLQRRGAVMTIQNSGRAYLSRCKYMKKIKAIRTIQAFVRTCAAKLKWTRLRRGLRTLHSLSRGYIVRQHVLRMLMAIRTLQNFVRAFLRRNKEYWGKVRAALLFQAAWRGFKTRIEREDIVDYLALRRQERLFDRGVRVIQAFWRATLVRRRYTQLVQAAICLQHFVRSNQLRARFKRLCRVTQTIQRVGRGFLARKRVRDMRTINMVADELWRLKTVREREALQLKVINDDPDAAIHPGGSRRGVSISKQMGRSGDHRVGNTRKGRTFQFKVLDVDTMVDTSDMYPKGWSAVYGDLDAALSRGNQRIEYIAMGKSHCVALDSTGYLWTWGWGDRGQLGHGTWSNYGHPRKLEMLAFVGDGALRSQGQRRNGTGAFGRDIAMRTQVRQVASGDDHCIALSAAGHVWTWGAGSRGQLGHGWPSNQPDGAPMPKFRVKSHTPRRVETLKRTVVEVAAGSHHSVALVNAGSVYVWGAGKQLGLGVFVGDGDRALPACVKTLTKFRVRHIGCGNTYTSATTHSGDVYTWGIGAHGQLGQGDTQDRVVPCVIRSLRKNGKHARVADVACGARHAIAMTSTGKCYAWGWNHHGQLGLGHRDDVTDPTLILRLRKHNVVNVAAGYRSSMCMFEKGELWAWGMCGCVIRPQKNRPGAQGKLHHDLSRDPDADNTQFETSVPLEIPWNRHSSRRPIGITVGYSRSACILQVRYRNEGAAKRSTLAHAQPLLLNRAELLAEADSLLTDHERINNWSPAAENVAGQGGGEGGGRLALTNGSRGAAPSTQHAGLNGENPFAVLREDLDLMDGDQLKALIIDLQNSSPDRLKISPSRHKSLSDKNRHAAGKYNALANKHKLRRGRNDLTLQLQYQDSDERAVNFGLKTYKAGDTRGELLANYSYRNPSEYAIERAKEQSWAGTGKYRRYKGGFETPFEGKDVRTGRPKPRSRTYSIESRHRTELLKFSSKHEDDREAYLAMQKGSAGLVQSNDSLRGPEDPGLFPRSSQSKTLNRPTAQQLEAQSAEERARKAEDETALRAAIDRIRVEGIVEGGAMLEFFTPEQLVATSNDDLAVQDVMRMRLERGENISPLKPRRKVIPKELEHLVTPMRYQGGALPLPGGAEGSRLPGPPSPDKRSQLDEEERGLTLRNMITKTVPNPKLQNRRYTMQMQKMPLGRPIPAADTPDPVAIAVARERQRISAAGGDGTTLDMKNPDILDLYREQELLRTIPSYSGNFQTMGTPGSGSKRGQWSGRRQSRADAIRGQIYSEIFPERQQSDMERAKGTTSSTEALSSLQGDMSPQGLSPPAGGANDAMVAEVASLRAQLEAMKARNAKEEFIKKSAEKVNMDRQEKQRSYLARRASHEAKSHAASIRRQGSINAASVNTINKKSDITAMIENIKRKADAEVHGLLQKHGGSPRKITSLASSVPLPPPAVLSAPTQNPVALKEKGPSKHRKTGSVNDLSNYVKKYDPDVGQDIQQPSLVDLIRRRSSADRR